MARGIDLSNLHGRTPGLYNQGVATTWKGITVFRNLPKKFVSDTTKQAAIRAAVKMLSQSWLTSLSDIQRQEWNAYAGNIYDLDKWGAIENSVRQIIPKHKPIMSGFNAFISRNLLAMSVGLPIPRSNPPILTNKEPSPIVTSLTYNAGTHTATVNWINPQISGIPTHVLKRSGETSSTKLIHK